MPGAITVCCGPHSGAVLDCCGRHSANFCVGLTVEVTSYSLTQTKAPQVQCCSVAPVKCVERDRLNRTISYTSVCKSQLLIYFHCYCLLLSVLVASTELLVCCGETQTKLSYGCDWKNQCVNGPQRERSLFSTCTFYDKTLRVCELKLEGV